MRGDNRGLLIAVALASISSSIGGFGRGVSAMARKAINYSPSAPPVPKPFSSDRQHARHRRTQYTRVVNGFELMQTFPSKDRG